MAKAHIFPRALVHEMKDGGRVVYAVDRRKLGFKEYQSGPWERGILCQSCEKKLSGCDNYAIRWIRRFDRDAVPIFGGRGFEVPNPKPHLLVQFAASVLWRAAVAERHTQPDLDLGPWEPMLREAIFDPRDFQPGLFVARKRYVTAGELHGAILVHPYHAPGLGRRAYVFEVGNLFWALKLDRRRGGEKLFRGPFRANENLTTTVINLGDLELRDQHDLLEIVALADGLRRD